MSEIFYQNGNVTIDRSLARFSSTSYPIANIGSVSTKKSGSIFAVAVGVIMAVVGIYLAATQPNQAIGAGVLFIGIVIGVSRRPKTALILRTSSGDEQAMVSPKHNVILEIKSAIEKAVIAR